MAVESQIGSGVAEHEISGCHQQAGLVYNKMLHPGVKDSLHMAGKKGFGGFIPDSQYYDALERSYEQVSHRVGSHTCRTLAMNRKSWQQAGAGEHRHGQEPG